MVKLNILICGIGGQGVVTTGKILAEAFSRRGFKVMEAETHGLAQRGGAVNVHVRIGDIEVPLIPEGGADYMIALEATELLRNINFLSKDAVIFVNAETKPSALPGQPMVDLNYILSFLKKWRTFVVDCRKISQSSGGYCNIAMLAYLFQFGLKELLDIEDILSAIPGTVNKRLFIETVSASQNYVVSGPAGI
ncbi:2-oxoacid:acceptor oxidoreductase family protein [Metallosphaera yellowstonensis]|jgi:Pyruvate:ferredoxin oxidoreductase and related 2-oxoacid:ferredoxin oxidoreductases, gamma subunit|uniref:2-oxoacid:acceptor oxidoreductase family protein n=1 Tax=Metallosphaera yellowstonensis TaxID=1111107 RepID=UPI00064FFE2B|nr:2-oxoacid:acceptor oxidoreductase family protein [Metallosphaera yellowstonensis]